ncbi:hypothetical protein CEE69_17770 [Rhodopirellula bahusiensis]|uniref:Uncharacterized protein n=1 Tax=Rhodopirellula bahusiensis TaxID=2014065 RepID=A0A2G1W438_9BACT|nr:hypothetical protein CEE69_17770 [Rhodopirellula bahusiensis]
MICSGETCRPAKVNGWWTARSGHGGKYPMREWRNVGRPFLVEIVLPPNISDGDEPTSKTTNHA